MDFLDSFDVDISKYKKSRRVRSWYLYEQFKSLEHNQLDAARKLKSRSYQDRILRQELSERKARRKLYDQFGHSQSECGIAPSVKSESTKTSLNVSSDDFFESFHVLQNEEELINIGDHEDDDDNKRNYQSKIVCEDKFESFDDQKDDESYSESVINVKSEETLTEDFKNVIEVDKQPQLLHTHSHMDLNFDVVKEKLQCLERLAHMRDLDKLSENGSLHSIEDEELKHIIMQDKNINTSDNNIYFMWTKLVSFAYQIMELNHGNCYYDYGSQLLTAVLACDVLRRGINRVCHILQPYVSPIKHNTDSDSSTKSHKNVKWKNQQRSKYYRNNHCYERCDSKHANYLEYSTPFSAERLCAKKYRRASEPGRSLTQNRRNPTFKTSYTSWPHFTGDDHTLCVKTCTRCCCKVVNPMLHISRCLDKIIMDINGP